MIVDAEECEVDEELEASGAALASGAASEAPGAAKAPPGRWKKAQAKVHDVGRAAAGAPSAAEAAARKVTKNKLSQRDYGYTARGGPDDEEEEELGGAEAVDQDEDAIAVARDRILKAAFDARQAYRKEKELNAAADGDA